VATEVKFALDRLSELEHTEDAVTTQSEQLESISYCSNLQMKQPYQTTMLRYVAQMINNSNSQND